MSGRTIRELSAPIADLAEGPYWDEDTATLSWVDLRRGVWLRAYWNGDDLGVPRRQELRGPLSCVVPVAGRPGSWLLAHGDRLECLEPDGAITVLASFPELRGAGQLNDGKCDPRGRLWIGSLDERGGPPQGRLYRVDLDGTISVIQESIGNSNGLAWNHDASTLYYVDTPTRRIDQFDYDLRTGAVAHRRTFVTFEESDGFPDGICTDTEGGVWVALWDGGTVRRYDGAGELTDTIEMPVSRPASCAFIGADRDHLLITTASAELTAEQVSAQPAAGRLFVTSTDYVGVSVSPYEGSLTMTRVSGGRARAS